MRKLIVLMAGLAALAACGQPAAAGVAGGKGEPGVGVPVQSITAPEASALADQVFPLIRPYGYFGVCGSDGQTAACPYTERLKARLAATQTTLCRCQNPSSTREIKAGSGPGAVDVLMYGGSVSYRLLLVRQDGKLLVDDELCGDRPQSSIYLALSAC